MTDLDLLLKEFEQPKKALKKETNSQQQKLPIPNLSTYPKNDFSLSDNRKGNIPQPTEQHRTSITKQPTKSTTEQGFDLDAVLLGHSNAPPQQQSSKISHSIAPAKNSAASTRRDSLSDWLNEERSKDKNSSNQTFNFFPQKVTTNGPGKPAIDLEPDDFFSNNNNNRDQSATKGHLATKNSAKQYYLGSSRYKPG